MTELIAGRHSVSGAPVFEIWIDGEMAGAIYALGGDKNGVRVISKFLPLKDGTVSGDPKNPGVVEVKIDPPPKEEEAK
jgi:hypothetical protein